MKNGTLLLSIAVSVAIALAAAPLQAQTCAAPASWQPDTSGQPVLIGTTCGGETNNGGGFCGGNFDAPGPAYIMQLHFAPSRTFSAILLQNTSVAGFDPVMYVSAVADGCGTDASCIATGDADNSIRSQDIPNGDFYFVVTSASIDGAGACGTFSLVTNGTIPVTLQSFDID